MGNGLTYIIAVLNTDSPFNDTLGIRFFAPLTDWIRIVILLSSADIPIYEVIFFMPSGLNQSFHVTINPTSGSITA